MWLCDATQALLLAVVRCSVDEVLVHLLIEQQGGFVLGNVRLRDEIRPDPVLARLPSGLVPAGAVSEARVLNALA